MPKKARQGKQLSGATEVIGYVRVSTAEQADSGLSLASQRARIEAQCLANDWDLVKIHEDAGASAKTLERPGLQAALGDLRPGRVLLALKLDRLTRSVRDLYDLQTRIETAGAEWACIAEKFDTTTATGRLMLSMIVQLSQWEREVIAERTAAALETKRLRGERLGTTPLGYATIEAEDGSRQVVVVEREMETVEYARQLRRERCTLRQIADVLNREGHTTKRGGYWHASTVQKLLEVRYLENTVTTCRAR